jgi:hypothetical protein
VEARLYVNVSNPDYFLVNMLRAKRYSSSDTIQQNVEFRLR